MAAEPTVHIAGPTGCGTYNVIVDDAISGFHAMSLSPEALIKLSALLAPMAYKLAAGETVVT